MSTSDEHTQATVEKGSAVEPHNDDILVPKPGYRHPIVQVRTSMRIP